jgi:hypothetical protein
LAGVYSHAVDEAGQRVAGRLEEAVGTIREGDGAVPLHHVLAAARIRRRRHGTRTEEAGLARVVVLALSS